MNRLNSQPRNSSSRCHDYCTITLAAFFLTVGAYGQNVKRSSQAEGGEVARGKYLVENVAMCGQCHTPRESDGKLDPHRTLQGAPVFMLPSNPDPKWPLSAPRIGGAPPAGDADMIKLLTTGIWTNGKPLRFPMMPFHMSEPDAKAIVAYLKTVSPQ
jgi:hypothetical protein